MYNLDLGIGLIVLSHVVAGHKSHVKAKLPDKSPNLALWELSAQDNVKRLHARQDPPRPPYTDYPVCDDEDGYLFVTQSGNMTFQVQCTTTYVGAQDNYAPTDDLYGCIDFCANLNIASRGSCLGVNWNAPFVGSGDCNTFSGIIDALPAFEGGGYQEAALLIYGNDGTIYATPRPLDAPSSTTTTEAPLSTTDQASSIAIVPPSSSTTITSVPSILVSTTGLSSTNSRSPSLSSAVSVNPGLGGTSTTSTFGFTSSFSTCSQSTTTVTSMITRTSCPPGVSCGTVVPAPTTTITDSLLPPPPGSATTTSSTTAGLMTTSMQPPTTGPNGQVTTFVPIPVTVFEVLPLLICDTAACSPSARTGTLVSFRTGLSCSPNACSGGMINTQTDALFAAPTCVLIP